MELRFTVPNVPLTWPKEPEKKLLSKYDTLSQQLKKAAPCAESTVISPSVNDSEHLQTSCSGIVPNGLPDARGFIVKESAYKTSSVKALEEDALDKWNKSRPSVVEQIKVRDLQMTTPLMTESPDQWLTTYQRNHVNLLPASTRDTRTNSFKDPYARIHSSAESDEQRLKRASEYAEEYHHRNNDSKDIDTLRQKLVHEQHYGVMASQNGNTVKDLDRPVQLKGKVKDVAPLTTTSATTYGFFDRSFYTEPSQLYSLEISEDEALHLQQRLQSTRFIDDYNTTYGDSFKGQLAPADSEFRKSHHFDKIQTTLQMPRQHRELKLKPNNFQENAAVSEIVPEHFKTMYATMNQHLK